MTAASSAAQEAEKLKYEQLKIKAEHLLNFTRFIAWPPDPKDTGPLTICLANEDPFGDVLTQALRGERVNGRPLRARVVREVGTCHVVFVPQGVASESYLRMARGRAVLTVGENPDFLKQGGIVNFIVEDGKLRFEIDQEAAEKAKLKISSRLLRLARPLSTSGSDRPRGPLQ